MKDFKDFIAGRLWETDIRVLRSLKFFSEVLYETGDHDTYGDLFETLKLTRSVLADNIRELEEVLQEVAKHDKEIAWNLENINNPGFYRPEEAQAS